MICVGIDIGSCAVKAVAIKKAGKTFNILQTHFFPIKADEKEEQKKLLILGHLKSLANLYQSRETKYIFCLSQNEVSTEKLTFPFKEKYKIMKSLPFEMEEKLSLFDYKKMISDIKMTDLSTEKKGVLVFSTFKENISNLLNDIKPLGIEPTILTCEASAISNLFERKKEPAKEHHQKEEGQKIKEECHLYLKISHTHTMAMILANNHLQNVYSFEWGAASCIRKIAVKYEIPFHKAMEQFCEKAFVLTQTRGYTGSQIEFSKVIQEAFENLIDKLRLLLLQMEGEESYKCKKILLCGGGAQVRNLQTLLSTRLNIPVSRVENPPNFPQWNLRNNDIKQNNFITALGAAMEGLKKPKRPAVNFLREEFATRFNPVSLVINQWKQPLTLGISVLVLFSVYAVFRSHQSEKLSDKINRIFRNRSIQIAKLQPKQVTIERVQHFINSKKEWSKQNELTEKLNDIPSALDKVKKLSVAIKKQEAWNLEIQELNVAGNKVEIKGNISSTYLNTFKNNLTDLAENGTLKTLTTEQPKDDSTETNTSDTVVFKYSFIQKRG